MLVPRKILFALIRTSLTSPDPIGGMRENLSCHMKDYENCGVVYIEGWYSFTELNISVWLLLNCKLSVWGKQMSSINRAAMLPPFSISTRSLVQEFVYFMQPYAD